MNRTTQNIILSVIGTFMIIIVNGGATGGITLSGKSPTQEVEVQEAKVEPTKEGVGEPKLLNQFKIQLLEHKFLIEGGDIFKDLILLADPNFMR